MSRCTYVQCNFQQKHILVYNCIGHQCDDCFLVEKVERRSCLRRERESSIDADVSVGAFHSNAMVMKLYGFEFHS